MSIRRKLVKSLGEGLRGRFFRDHNLDDDQRKKGSGTQLWITPQVLIPNASSNNVRRVIHDEDELYLFQLRAPAGGVSLNASSG